MIYDDGTPTLIVGLGGIGGQIAGAIYDTLGEQSKKTVSIVAIDTNDHDLWQLNHKHHIPCVKLSDELPNRKIIDNNPEVKAWFPDEPYLTKYPCNSGAGMIRAIARLAFVNAEKQGRLDIIEREITRIRLASDELGRSSQIRVCIVGSIVGGTGSCLVVCLPFYLRHIIKKAIRLKRCVIDGYLIGADPIFDLMPSSECKTRVRANAYACLKELNAFYLQPLQGNHSNNIRLEFYDHTDTSIQNIPYDRIVLFDDYIGDVRFDEFAQCYAQKIISNLAMNSKMAFDIINDCDGMYRSTISNAGMRRYCPAGMYQLVYPQKSAQEYVTLVMLKHLLQDEWLLIDSEYRDLVKEALRLKVEDKHVEMPEIRSTYVSLFLNEAFGDHAKLGKLGLEAIADHDNNNYLKSAEFVTTLDSEVEKLLNLDELRIIEEKCQVILQKMKSFTDAESHICDVWEGLRDYNRYAKHLIDTKPYCIAETLLSSTDLSEIEDSKTPFLNQQLSEIHPVTARFLIYDIINRIEDKVRQLKSEITDIDPLAYAEVDFDSKTEGIQNPIEYIDSLQNKQNPLLRKLGTLGKLFDHDIRSLKKLGEQLLEVSDTHILAVRKFMVKSIKYHVSQIILERLYKLADAYTLFFSEISEIADQNNKHIEKLENLSFPYNQYGIYCSTDAFRKMASDFIALWSQDISTETKIAISNHLFGQLYQLCTISILSETKEEKERRYQQTKKSLKSLFESTVMVEIRKTVIEHGAGIVNLSVREALIKELELKEQIQPCDLGYHEAVEKSVKTAVNFAMIHTVPLLRTEFPDSKVEQLLFILSPECANTDVEFDPDNTATARFYLPSSADATVILNSKALDTELTFIRICYYYSVEEILNYKHESENENAYLLYTQRIGAEKRDLCDVPVITPHLDKYWHEEGIIPALHGKQRQENHINCIKAFIYGISCGLFQKYEDNSIGHDTWRFNINGNSHGLIRKCSSHIDGSYYSLLDALTVNGRIVKKVLACAKSSVRQFGDCLEIDNVLDSSFISGLCGNNTNINIFDVFLSIRASTPEDEWNEIFSCLLDVIWEFLNRMGCPLNHVDEYAHKTMDTIFASCSIGKKGNDSLVVSDMKLIQQFKKILEKKYST